MISIQSVLVCFCLTISAASALSSAGYVNIVGLPGGATQSLPTDYVKNFQQWQVTVDAEIVPKTCIPEARIEATGNLQVQPSLDVLLKGGSPAYVMAGVTIRGNSEHYCPIARQWTTFSFAVEPSFRLESFVAQSGVNGAEEEYQPLFSTSNTRDDMSQAMESFGILLSQLDESSPLSSGFHIVSLPRSYDWLDFPSSKGQYKIVCLATAEPDAKELLTMDDELVQMTASSVLEVTIHGPKTCANGS